MNKQEIVTRIRGQYIRLRRDGGLVVCLQYAPQAGYICVDGLPNARLRFVWVEQKR